MENNLSSALVFVRDHKIKGYMKSVKFNDDGLSYYIRFSYGKYFETKRDVV